MAGGDDKTTRKDIAIAQTAVDGSGPRERASTEELVRGAALGRFTVVEELGAGGMGVVVAAYDPKLDRKVAIKVLRPNAWGSQPEHNAHSWMMREAQAMARLSHPNVVAVYDVGEVGDRVYIAMELSDGTTLTRWLADADRSWQEIVDIFIEAGRGLAAAHTAGLVHRDFKPDNVLVSRAGRVRVTDFGLVGTSVGFVDTGATPDDDTPLSMTLTDAAGLVGTPAFMAPEQHRREELDARADQFAFCVALYEALYGDHPFEGKNYWELARNVQTGNVRPAPPNAEVPARIRNALLRGLSVDRDERYPSVDALLEDLATPAPTRSTRRRLLVEAGVLALVGIGAFVVMRGDDEPAPAAVCTGAARKLDGVWDAQVREQVRRGFVASERAHAEKTFERVASSLDDYTGEWVAMHETTCRATRIDHAQPEEIMHLRMACLAQRRNELAALGALLETADDDVVDNALNAVSGLTPVARCADVATLSSARPLPSDPAVRRRVDALRVQVAHAQTLHRAGRYLAGLEVAERAERDSRDVDYPPVRAEVLYTLGLLRQYVGDAEGAERALHASAEAAAEAGDDEHLALSWMHLVWVVGYMQSHPEEAIGLARAAETALARAGNDPEIRAELHVITGAVYSNNGDYDSARRQYQAAIDLEDEIGHDHTLIAGAYNNLGNLEQDLHDYEAAARNYEIALEISRASLGETHPHTAVPLGNLGESRLLTGRYEEALDLCDRALAILRDSYGETHREMFYPLSCIGSARVGLGRYDEAIEPLEAALRVTVPNPNAPWEQSLAEFALARALWETRRDRARAVQLARGAHDELAKHGELTAPDLADVDAWLAKHRR